MFCLLTIPDLGPDPAAGRVEELHALLAEQGAALPGVKSAAVGRTLPRDLNGGHLLWRLAFACEPDFRAAVASAAWRSRIAPALSADRGVQVDWVAYRSDRFRISGQAQPGIWRCLVCAVDRGPAAETIARFERDLLLMPEHVTTIRSWSLGRVVAGAGRRQWTHVWEQEFDDVAGLEGEYMAHPIHWGLVDGWFDPECPQRIVDPLLIHAAFGTRQPVIV